MTEMFDIYDENLTHIGVKARAAVHTDGDWHKVFNCWVIYRDDDGQDWVILQKRAATKDTFPDMLDISAAGHYEAGESTRDGIRELEEELGLSPKFEDLIPLGRRVSVTKYNSVVDRQFANVFFYICDQPLSAYQYQKDEIAGLLAMKADDGLRLLVGDIPALDVPCVGFDSETVCITSDNFIPAQDHYFEKICVLARRCLDGEKYLWI